MKNVFYQHLRVSQLFKEFIKQAEGHRPTYEDEDAVMAFKNEAEISAWLLAQRNARKNPASPKPDKKPVTRKKTGKKKTTKTYHNENWDVLLPFGVSNKNKPKLSALIDEATRLPLTFPYSASMLLRSLIESLLIDFIRNDNHIVSVCNMVFEEQANADRPFDDDQKKKYKPGLDVIIRWLNKNPDAFPDSEKRECQKATQKLSMHKKGLNGVVHEQDLTSSNKLKPIRDDIYHLIKTLLERIDDEKD